MFVLMATALDGDILPLADAHRTTRLYAGLLVGPRFEAALRFSGFAGTMRL